MPVDLSRILQIQFDWRAKVVAANVFVRIGIEFDLLLPMQFTHSFTIG